MGPPEDLCPGRGARACLELCQCGWCDAWRECARRDNGSSCPGFEPAACGRPLQWAEAAVLAALFALALATFALSLALVCRAWGRGPPGDPTMRLTLHGSDSDDER